MLWKYCSPVLALNISHVQAHAQLPGVHILGVLAWTAAKCRQFGGAGPAWTAALRRRRHRLARTAGQEERAGGAALAGPGSAPPNKLTDFVARRRHVVVPVVIRWLPVMPLQLHALGPRGPKRKEDIF